MLPRHSLKGWVRGQGWAALIGGGAFRGNMYTEYVKSGVSYSKELRLFEDVSKVAKACVTDVRGVQTAGHTN